MEIVKETKIGDEVEVQFEFSADEYDNLYEQYLQQKELFYKSENYTFEDYFQELITLILLKEKEKTMKAELKELEKEIEFVKSEIQANIDSNNA